MFPNDDSLADRVEKIYREHSAFVWRVLCNCGMPQSDRKDALQEIFLKVLQQLSKYKERGSLKGWLFVVAKTHVLQFHRTEGRRARRMSSYADGVSGQPGQAELDELIKLSEAAQLVQRFMDELSAYDREHVLLHWIEEMSGAEVARLLDVNINTFYGREARIRKAFEEFRQRCKHPRMSSHG